jgi:starch synthase (maltosyl-transferring)
LHEPFDLVDALTGESYTWGARNYVRLGPGKAHVLEVRL